MTRDEMIQQITSLTKEYAGNYTFVHGLTAMKKGKLIALLITFQKMVELKHQAQVIRDKYIPADWQAGKVNMEDWLQFTFAEKWAEELWAQQHLSMPSIEESKVRADLATAVMLEVYAR